MIISLGGRSKGSLLRRVLVLTQFIVAIFLIICTFIIHRQLNYVRNKELGFDKDNLISIVQRNLSDDQVKIFKNELLKNPYVENVTCGAPPISIYAYYGSSAVDWEGKKPGQKLLIYCLQVGYDYIKTFKMKIITGRNFSREFPEDATESYIVNKKAAKAMGMKSPIGKKFSFEGKEGRIIGVVNNFHQWSLHNEIEPMLLKIGRGARICVRLKPHNANSDKIIDFIKKKWEKIVPGYPFVYGFVNEYIDKYYIFEKRLGAIINYFTLLAIFISCLGLFGLSSYLTEQRTKEIGIRKAVGATVPGIVIMLSKEFTFLMIIANILAWPAAYLAVNSWLQNFAYRIDFNLLIFFFAGVLALVIALITVSFQALKAALANPVESLRYE